MIIDIDDTTRVQGTKWCWQLEEWSEKRGWRACKYFTTLRQALHSAAQREIRTDPATTLADALEAVERVTTKYAAVFDRVGNYERT